MKKLLFSILLVMVILTKGYSQYDSIVVYHRTFCSDYGKVNNDLDKIKSFSVVKKVVLKENRKIEKLLMKLEKLRLYKDDTNDFDNAYVLGGYGYQNGREELLFTISTFNRLTYKNQVYKYNNKFLDFLFSEKPPCYFS